MRITLLLTCTAALGVAANANAQSLWGVHGASGQVVQVAGPSLEGVPGPSGPVTAALPIDAPFLCPTPTAWMPDVPVGDVAVDRATDTLWVTDGNTIGHYTKAGAVLGAFDNPLTHMLRGLGWGLVDGQPVLWITDGYSVGGVQLPTFKACTATPLFTFPPRPVTSPGDPADVDFDPATVTLFFANLDGTITNETLDGALGPYGTFEPPPYCGTDTPAGFTGIAVDTSVAGVLYLTNGLQVLRIQMGGGFDSFAPGTFYSPMSFFDWPGEVPIAGLAFDASPVLFAEPCGLARVTPEPGWVGQATSPNPNFALTLTNAEPGALAWLMIGADAVNPYVEGTPFALSVWPPVAALGPFPVDADGVVVIGAPLPERLGGVGYTALAQWVVAGRDGAFVSAGLAMTFSMP